MQRFWLGLSLILLLSACGSKKIVTIDDSYIEEQQLDTLYVTASPITEEERAVAEETRYELPIYNPSHRQENDLLHTRLDLRFDWEKEQVIGDAQLRLRPYFYPTSRVVLDAKGFDFQEITISGEPLAFTYDGIQVNIELPRTYTREEEYTIDIKYIATPAQSGGSEAILSDKGLFFINPRGEEGDKPKQIWTQGETENNSRWFPTIDKPNERCTQEMILTVADQYETLSNGILVSSTPNDDGTRTDIWKMDQPHAPYLFMLAIGEFAVVEDEPWNGIPVNYYVEPEYEEHAEAIFPYTPEMLTFFSDITGVPYPWPKYSQVVVRDYVSGAMENTTGVIFGEFMQQTDRELIDVLINEKIVAHEMMHHWFGDLVTCENWANLTLNEGFANYSEYLWLEHNYGRDEADYHMLQEWNGYFSSAANGIHPLIYYGYHDKEDMFDAHSYNKGGSVLHMLRAYVGDDAFFTAWKRYLEDNAYSAVEVDELRLAFEDVTGQDLHWFFNQWFLDQGHPDLLINYDYEAGSEEAIVRIEQRQDPEKMPAIFELPVSVDLYFTDQTEPVRYQVMVNQREQELRFPAEEKPALIVFDAERVLLSRREDEKSDDELVYQFYHAPRFLDRYEAIDQLERSDHPKAKAVIEDGLKDEFYAIRGTALRSMDADALSKEAKETIRKMAISDPHSDVRYTALLYLEEMEDDQIVEIAKEAIRAESFTVVAGGLEVLGKVAPEEALLVIDELKGETSVEVINAIGNIYAEIGDPENLDYFATHLNDMDGFEALDFFTNYILLLGDADDTAIAEGIQQLKTIALNMGQSPWRRIAATKGLSDLRQAIQRQARNQEDIEAKEKLNATAGELRLIIDEIKAKETNEQLRSIYQQF